MVRVTIRGTGLVVDVTIDPEAVRYYDAETLGGLVLEAINDGMRRAVVSARDKFSVALSDLSLFDDLLTRWPQPNGLQPSTTVAGDDWQGW
jgi:DNA-binding protein YbaB